MLSSNFEYSDFIEPMQKKLCQWIP